MLWIQIRKSRYKRTKRRNVKGSVKGQSGEIVVVFTAMDIEKSGTITYNDFLAEITSSVED